MQKKKKETRKPTFEKSNCYNVWKSTYLNVSFSLCLKIYIIIHKVDLI